MPLAWSGISTGASTLEGNQEKELRALLDELGDAVERSLTARGLPRHLSPLFRPFNLYAARGPDQLHVVFSAAQGIPSYRWVKQTEPATPAGLASALRAQLGWDISLAFSLPLDPGQLGGSAIADVADAHVQQLDTSQAVSRVRGADAVPHLVPYLRAFLASHPDPDRNVFIMMRFRDTDQMQSINRTIRDALAGHGMAGLRADDRDYTGELWSNLQIYMTGCHFGIAVFEDIDDRDFNPNVSLELGYMLGTSRRCLLLKEKRLPNLPTDVVNRLYKPFDAFHIEETVSAQIDRWVSVDLGATYTGPAS